MDEPAVERHRFYGEFAEWWPLISPVDDYAEEAAFSAGLLRVATRPVRDVLELGSGGGHNAWYLKREFDLTLVDLSAEMLASSRRLNPECTHFEGDMRTVRLDRDFDAVFVHDAVAYMTTENDLRAAIETAFAHCRPGGVAVFAPDDTRETFVPDSDIGGVDSAGRAARYLEWSWDPDPSDTTVRTEYAFVFRRADGSVQYANETHITGLFDRATWLRLLIETGFDASIVVEETTEDRIPRDMFVGRRAHS